MNRFTDSYFFSSQPTLAEVMDHELKQFKIHQSLSLPLYVNLRLSFLEKQIHAELNAAYVAAFQPKVAVFAGSFNPFHKGHYNVLQKAERIFDKVIVAFGKNPEKDGHPYKVPTTLNNRQVEQYDSLLTDFISSLGHDVTVIRGLRNSTDFQYEQNQYRYIQELMPDIKIVNIFCDKEFEHISSSGIRTLEPFGRHRNYLLE
ncbi:MAG: adenylyltransferase/cytidyltransferase family protein [bacterium]|nr:adenylyltransferase/cytidyltransferase family protein [bacterium]